MTQLVRPLLTALLVGSVLAGCAAGAGVGGSGSRSASSSAPSASASASAQPTPSTPASDGSGSSDGGGAVGGNPGTVSSSPPISPVGPGQSPGSLPQPSPTEVQPVAGLLNVHDVRAMALQAGISNGHLLARVFWWSGPPPCSGLDGVGVVRTGDTFTLTVREGAAQLGVACPALAMYKVTAVDLGPVSPGTFRVGAVGVDLPVVVLYAG